MDFNTRPSGAGGGTRPPGGTGTISGPGGPSHEFNLSDPVGSFVATVRGVVLNPVGFYRGIRKSGDILSPLIFALICVLVSAVIGGILGTLFTVAIGSQGIGGGIIGFFGGIIRNLISAVIGLFVGAAILHVLVLLFTRPGNAGYEATFRVSAYAYVVYLVSWIPILGWILSLYSIVLAIIGIREVHNTTTGKAALVVLIPIAIVLFLALIVAVIAGAALFTILQQQ